MNSFPKHRAAFAHTRLLVMVGILIILLGVAWAVWPSSKESDRAKGTVAEGTDGKKSHKGDGKKHGKKKKNGDKKGGGKKSDTESAKAE